MEWLKTRDGFKKELQDTVDNLEHALLETQKELSETKKELLETKKGPLETKTNLRAVSVNFCKTTAILHVLHQRVLLDQARNKIVKILRPGPPETWESLCAEGHVDLPRYIQYMASSQPESQIHFPLKRCSGFVPSTLFGARETKLLMRQHNPNSKTR
ncbi:hypothetical protein OG21DRAFT_1490070 [Imleria badia]|nr:hypothetical protein OG21DRAFT_1490070 [Imleria badia]